MINLPITKTWSIKTPIVYRYMPRKYVEQFFDDGSIMLSSFSQFSKHENEEQLDKNEGKHILYGKGKSQTVFAVTGHGRDCYVLCATSYHDEKLMREFKCDAGIKIKNTTEFGARIAHYLPGLKQGIEGPCTYQYGSIECDINDFSIEQLKIDRNKKELDLNKLGSFVLGMGGLEVFFRKSPKFSHQNEYRFLWGVTGNIQDTLIIKVPELRELCEPVHIR